MRKATLYALIAVLAAGCADSVTAPAPELAAPRLLLSPASLTLDDEDEVIRVPADAWTLDYSGDRKTSPLHSSTVKQGVGIMVTILQSARIEHGDPVHLRVTLLSPDVSATHLWIWVDSFSRALVPAPTMRGGRGSATYVLDLPVGSYHHMPYPDPNLRHLVVYPLSQPGCCPFMDGASTFFYVNGLAEWFPPLP